MGSGKGQASLEQMITTAMGIAAIMVIFAIAFNYANDNVRVAQGRDAIDKIAKAADYVNQLGTDAKTAVYINMPAGVKFINSTGNRIQMRMALSGGETDVFANTQANISGQISVTPGGQKVIVTSFAAGNVRVGADHLACSPAFLTASVEQGNSSSANVTLSNTAAFRLDSIGVNVSGIASGMIRIVSAPGSLEPGASGSVELLFEVPLPQRAASYQAVLIASGSNSSLCTSSITLFAIRRGGEDTEGPLAHSLGYTPLMPNINTNVMVHATGDDGGRGDSAIRECQSKINGTAWNGMAAADGNYDSPLEQSSGCAIASCGRLGTVGSYTFEARCRDEYGNLGPVSNITFFVWLSSDTEGPNVTYLNWTPQYPDSATNVTIVAIGEDTLAGGSNISLCRLWADSEGPYDMVPTDGIYGEEVVEGVNYTLGILAAGVHNVSVQCIDSAGNPGPYRNASFEVAEPETLGPNVTYLNVTPYPANTSSFVLVNATGSDVGLGGSRIAICQYSLDGNATWGGMNPVDGAYDNVTEDVNASLGKLNAGRHSVAVRCNDTAGNMGNESSINFTVLDVDGPNVTYLNVTPNPANASSFVWVNASATDVGFGGSNISMCNVSIDGSAAWKNMNASDGAYNNASERVNYSIGYMSAGKHNVSVRCNDSAGNWGSAKLLNFSVKDIDGPNVTYLNVTPAAPNMTEWIFVNASATDVGFGGSNISMCNVSIDGSAAWKNMNASDGAYNNASERVNYSIGYMSAGKHNVSVRCNDSAGNWGSAKLLNFSVLDNLGPNVTYLNITPLAPSSTSPIQVNAIANDSLTGGSNISMCNLKLASNNVVTWYGMIAVDGAYSSNVSENVTYPIAPLEFGQYNLSVVCDDTLGNWGLPRKMSFIVSDGMGPNVSYLGITPAAPNTTSSIIVNATANDSGVLGNSNISMCSVSLDGGAWSNMNAVSPPYDSVTEKANLSIGTVGTPGSHTVAVKCNDSLGNWGAEKNLAFNVKDGIGPDVTAMSFAPPGTIKTTSNVTVLATGSDLNAGGSNISMCQLSNDSGATWRNMRPTDGQYNGISENVNYSLGFLARGSYNISVKCKDSAGNFGPILSQELVVEDGDGPSLTVLGITPSKPTTAMFPITVNATGNDTASGGSNIYQCEYRLDAGSWAPMAPADAYDSPVESASAQLSGLSINKHTVYARCIDAKGNVGANRSLEFNVTDGIGPDVGGIALSPSLPTSLTQIAVSAIASDASQGGSNISTCNISLDGGTWEKMNPVDGAYGSVTENVNYSLGRLDVGGHDVSIKCNDSAGNWGSPAIHSFYVQYGYNILFLKKFATTSAPWLDWIIANRNEYQNSELPWNVNSATSSDLLSGTVRLEDYRVVVMTDAGFTSETINMLKNHTNATGRYIVLPGAGIKNLQDLGGSTYGGYGTGNVNNLELTISQEAHEITAGYAGQTLVVSSFGGVHYNKYATGITLAYRPANSDHEVLIFDQPNRILAFGITSPVNLNNTGKILASRVLNYALNQSD
jgi:uncharacterized protein (UPF0333 family)